jgi:hypothetical protein
VQAEIATRSDTNTCAYVVESEETRRRVMYVQKRHWLDYDPVAIVVLVIGIGMIELLAMII